MSSAARKSPPPLLYQGGSSLQVKRGRGACRGGIFLAVFLFPLVAHAALFDDDEARRQISQLRTQIDSNQKAVDERLSAINARLSQMEAAGQNRVLDLAQLLDALKQDIARLRGQVEVLVNQTENLERRQKDLYVDLDNRLRKLEQTQSQLQDRLSQPDRSAAAEKQAYEAALNQLKLGNYQLAVTGFQNFMGTYANSDLVPNAQYWIGNAYFQMRDYKSAISAQRKVVRSWPDNPKAAEALYNVAMAQDELGDSRAARETLRALVKKYPKSPVAEQAKQRLARK
ncbi:MAG TPA: tol-pal system protein YbgF [Burkholderiales bacterium]